MLSPRESYKIIGECYKRLHARESDEAALSTNKPWITASKTKIKRDAPSHLPIEGDHPETLACRARRILHNTATVMIALDKGETADVLAARRKAVLSEVDVAPIEVAFLFGYTSDRPVRELRIRHGLDENSGRPLKDSQRPIISNRKRARR